MKYEVNWPVSFTPPIDIHAAMPQAGSGLDAMTGTLRRSALWPPDDRAPFVRHELDPVLNWYVIQDEVSASEYIKHTLDGSISTFVNWFDMEPHLKDIVFSHRTFTVILQHDLSVVTWSSKDGVVGQDHWIKLSKTANFNATYGDHYVSAMTRGQRRYVLWSFDIPAGTSGAFDLKQMTAEIFRNDVSLENGCNVLANLACRTPCMTSIWSGDQPADVQPQSVLGLLKEVLVTEQLPILKIEIRPYDPSIFPGLSRNMNPPYTPKMNTVRRLRETMLQAALLRISNRTSPLQSKEPFSDALIPQDLVAIAKAFRSAQSFDFIINLAHMLLLLARFAIPTWELVESLPAWIRDPILERIWTSANIDKTDPGHKIREYYDALLGHKVRLNEAGDDKNKITTEKNA